MFLANPGRFCGRGAALWCRNPLFSSNNITLGHLLKIERLVTNVTAVGSPDRAEPAILGVILIERVVREPLCDVGTSASALITLLRVI